MSVLTLPESIDEVVSWGAQRWHFAASPHDGARWMVKRPYCSGEQGGAWREVEVANALRAMGFLAYPVIAGEWEGAEWVALMHAEDANPGWKLLGSFSTVLSDTITPQAWLDYAAVSVALGIGDRHYGNVLLMQHELSDQVAMCSIDHECKCLSRECRPGIMGRPAEATHARFMDTLSSVISRAKSTGHEHLLNEATIVAASEPEFLKWPEHSPGSDPTK